MSNKLGAPQNNSFQETILEVLPAVTFRGDETVGEWAKMLNTHFGGAILGGYEKLVRNLISFLTANASEAYWLEEIKGLVDLEDNFELYDEDLERIQNAFANLDVYNEITQISQTYELDEYFDEYRRVNSKLDDIRPSEPDQYWPVYNQVREDEENEESIQGNWAEEHKQKKQQEQLELAEIDDMFSMLGDE